MRCFSLSKVASGIFLIGMVQTSWASSYADVTIIDQETGTTLSASSARRSQIEFSETLTLRVTPTRKTDRVRLNIRGKNCGARSQTDNEAPFEFELSPKSVSTQCFYKLTGWRKPWKWVGHQNMVLSFSEPTQETSTPETVKTPEPVKTPEVVKTPESVKTPEVVKTPEPVKTPEVVKTPEPVKTPEVVKTPEPVKTPEVVNTPEPVKTPEVVKTPEPVTTPVDVVTPVVIDTPDVIDTPEVVDTPAIVDTPEVIDTPALIDTPTTVNTPVVNTPPAMPTMPTPVVDHSQHMPASTSNKHVLTVGSQGQSNYTVGPVVGRSAHGNRIYCVISHFSYDDPIVYPGQPGKAHLHMFWGNTGTDAHSTPTSIPFSGATSCEGGSNYRSGIWIPALYNNQDEVVIPEETFIYYKTFLAGNMPANAINLLQVVPQGLEMLASKSTLNYRNHIKTERRNRNGLDVFRMTIHFPSCVATYDGTRTGAPILSYRSMPGNDASIINSNVSYPIGAQGNEVGCPHSHPYRFPGPELIVMFDSNIVGSNPYVSSDAMNNSTPMSTLHADYIFGMNDNVNQDVLRCVIEGRRCDFGDGRGALSERFYGPDGSKVYDTSIRLSAGTDRTPFGTSLKPMLH